MEKNDHNISLHREHLKLDVGKTYLVIDSLYVNDIRDAFFNKYIEEYDYNEIRRIVFPYVATPFTFYNSGTPIFDVQQIEPATQSLNTGRCFSVDSGLLIFINTEIFFNLLPLFDFEELVETNNGLINISYWKKLTSNFKEIDLALVLASSDMTFSGSGVYHIIS